MEAHHSCFQCSQVPTTSKTALGTDSLWPFHWNHAMFKSLSIIVVFSVNVVKFQKPLSEPLCLWLGYRNMYTHRLAVVQSCPVSKTALGTDVVLVVCTTILFMMMVDTH